MKVTSSPEYSSVVTSAIVGDGGSGFRITKMTLLYGIISPFVTTIDGDQFKFTFLLVTRKKSLASQMFAP